MIMARPYGKPGPHKHLYDTQAWRRRRARQLQAEPLCRWCKSEGRIVPASIADHIDPHRGDRVKFAGPLQSLCASCHSSRKQQLEKSGSVAGCDVQGIPLDPNHPWRLEIERQRMTGGYDAPTDPPD
jgi:5-methylcytosine-specific restriction enzyme A